MAHPDFNPPGRKPPKLNARNSTLRGLFVASLTPYIEPTDDEVDEALKILGMRRGHVRCAYCGKEKSEWDHFRPIVKNLEPTGYITEIANLVPSCGKCNQSKRGEHWRDWLFGPANLSPKTLGVRNLGEKARRLGAYERWRKPTQIQYDKVVGPALWRRYSEHLAGVVRSLSAAERDAAVLRQRVETWVRSRAK